MHLWINVKEQKVEECRFNKKWQCYLAADWWMRNRARRGEYRSDIDSVFLKWSGPRCGSTIQSFWNGVRPDATTDRYIHEITCVVSAHVHSHTALSLPRPSLVATCSQSDIIELSGSGTGNPKCHGRACLDTLGRDRDACLLWFTALIPEDGCVRRVSLTYRTNPLVLLGVYSSTHAAGSVAVVPFHQRASNIIYIKNTHFINSHIQLWQCVYLANLQRPAG